MFAFPLLCRRRNLGILFVVGMSWLYPPNAKAGEPAEIRFNTAFEGGSLGTVERVGDGSYRCRVRGQQDEHGRNRQASWYYFRMDGVQGRKISLVLTDFVGEYNGKPGACPMGPSIIPVYSEDGERWKSVPSVIWDDEAKEATIDLTPERNTIWLAHQVPYTPSRLASLLEQVERCPEARIEFIGKTV
ncbi:MAG TPA: M14-type cytosolic carboxypeptidase, partial [Isosphaeraceae bacterium]|nr:M14-type cytosolic carboxypeptidase [Isosphaeraceae bacterium]